VMFKGIFGVSGHQVRNSFYWNRKIFEDCMRIMTNLKGGQGKAININRKF